MVKKAYDEIEWEQSDVERSDGTKEIDLIEVSELVKDCLSIAPRLAASASLGLLGPNERRQLGYNFVALCSLGYRLNSKSQRIECTQCAYSFHKNESYNFDEHGLLGTKGIAGVQCPVWLKGGFTLNPRETQITARSNGEANQPISSLLSSATSGGFTEEKMDVDETLIQISSGLLSDQLGLLVHKGPKESLDESQMAMTLFEDDSEESNHFLSRENREDSLVKLSAWSSFTPTFAAILSLMGFYCFSETFKMLKCYFCKFLSPETSLRKLIRAHSVFSPRCCYAKFVEISTEILNRPEDNAAHLIAFNIFNNLYTFTDRYVRLSEALCVEAAACGLRFLPFKRSVKCTSCEFEAELEDSGNFLALKLSEMHMKHNPKCHNLGDSPHLAKGGKQKATINDDFFERLLRSPFYSYLNDLKCGSANVGDSSISFKAKSNLNTESKLNLQGSQEKKYTNYNEDITMQNYDVKEIKKEPGAFQEPSNLERPNSKTNASVTPGHGTPGLQDGDYPGIKAVKKEIKKEPGASHEPSNLETPNSKADSSETLGHGTPGLQDAQYTEVKAVKFQDSAHPDSEFRKTDFVMMESSHKWDASNFEELFLGMGCDYSVVNYPRPSIEKPHDLFTQEMLGPLTLGERQATSMVRDAEESGLCSVCLEKEASRVLVMCGHLSTCNECVLQVSSCPICRAKITGVMPVSLPRRNLKPKTDFESKISGSFDVNSYFENLTISVGLEEDEALEETKTRTL